MTNMTAQEVVKLILKLTKENQKLLGDYKDAMSKLDKAVTLVRASEKKWWVTYKTPITIALTLLTVLIFIAGVIWLMKTSNMCVVNVGQEEKSLSIQSCQSIK